MSKHQGKFAVVIGKRTANGLNALFEKTETGWSAAGSRVLAGAT